MDKAVRLVPLFRCKGCGALYHPYEAGILAVDDGKLTEQDAVKKVMQAVEIHDCDIDKIGIAACVGFGKVERLEKAGQEGGRHADAGALQYGA